MSESSATYTSEMLKPKMYQPRSHPASRSQSQRVVRAPPCSQNGYLSSRGGGQNRWHSLVSCDHGDSTTSRFDSPPARGGWSHRTGR
jgi:hypothetical protein